MIEVTKTALDILRDARARIADPQNWGKGLRPCRADQNTRCAAEAIEEASLPNDQRRRAFTALANAYAVDEGVTVWNDHATHCEVISAFDLAIATLRLS